MRWLGLCLVWGAIQAEEIFPLQVQHADQRLSDKTSRLLEAVAIDQGDDDEIIIVASHGGIYEWSAELRIGPQVVPLKVHDLVYSGMRIKLGKAFTAQQREVMTLVVISAILK